MTGNLKGAHSYCCASYNCAQPSGPVTLRDDRTAAASIDISVLDSLPPLPSDADEVDRSRVGRLLGRGHTDEWRGGSMGKVTTSIIGAFCLVAGNAICSVEVAAQEKSEFLCEVKLIECIDYVQAKYLPKKKLEDSSFLSTIKHNCTASAVACATARDKANKGK